MLSLENKFPSISVIILNYNGISFLEKCLKAVFASDYPNFEVIFVDNGSIDGSNELVKNMFKSDSRLKTIQNSKNFGFAKGNNIGAKQAQGNILVFLNNDTEIDRSCLRQIYEAISANNEIGAAQCKLRKIDNRKTLESVGHYIDYFGIAHVRGENEIDRGQYDYVSEIFAATGAALVVRNDVFEKVGGFDSDFFLTFEETDLCWRIWLAGYKIVLIPKAIVYHKGSGTVQKTLANNNSIYLFCRNRLMSLLKNYSLKNLFRVIPVNTGILLAYSLLKIKDHNVRAATAILRSIMWNVIHLNLIIFKRKIVQSTRKISDDFLMKEELIEPLSFEKLVSKL